MNPFTLLYLVYAAKLSSQASIYFIWLVDSSSRTIAFIAAAVAVLAVLPFFHVIVHVFSAKPLSNPIFIAYLCFSFLLAILWYKPTQDGEQRVLPFAIVTAFDLLDLFIFLFQRQIGHWHNVLTSDIEQGHIRAENLDEASVALVGRGNKQVHPRDLGARLEPSQNEIRRLEILQEAGYDINAINRSGRPVDDPICFEACNVEQRSSWQAPNAGFNQRLDGGEAGESFAGAGVASQRPESVGWNARMVQPVHQEMEEVDLEPHSHQRQSGFFIDLGVSAVSKIEDPPSPLSPAGIISSNIHPAFRRPKITPPLLATGHERNQI